MGLDKSWIQIIDRTQPSYEQGVLEFLEFAFNGFDEGELLRCPCKKCNNNLYRSRKVIYEHLIMFGIKKDYVIWDLHGEIVSESEDDEENDDEQNCNDGLREMLHDIGSTFNIHNIPNVDGQPSEDKSYETSTNNEMNEEAYKFYRLLHDAEQELYPECEHFSKLSFIVQLLNIKCLFGLSAKSIDALLSLLTKAFPKGNKVPMSYFEARKVIRELGLDYEKIDACLNDCILYRGEHLQSKCCPSCGVSPYKDPNKKLPQKVLRYFPLAPRLQRLYMSSNSATEMRWHKDRPIEDGQMRHPADSIAWKSFDSQILLLQQIHVMLDLDWLVMVSIHMEI
ncbi:uncharacterized protein LOC133302942 [Gastrolobium bilobum]|uniref:uncharacterized protein LOC133302942 n=1 Tax=Gastrolobium bilobum TaxID=150636 RepID=UPI002AB24901|nr:uncharacterized protein LOC133302942 [Gastrolobium bilobum]